MGKPRRKYGNELRVLVNWVMLTDSPTCPVLAKQWTQDTTGRPGNRAKHSDADPESLEPSHRRGLPISEDILFSQVKAPRVNRCELFHDSCIVPGRGDVERRPALVVDSIYLCTSLEEQFDDIQS